MSSPVRMIQRPLRRARVAGAAPRFALYAACAVLCVAGAASILRGHKTIHETLVSAGRGFDLAAAGFATEFTRAYLTYRLEDLSEREQALSRFANASIDQEAGVAPGASQSVVWAQPAQEQPQPGGGEVVTVAVQTSAHPFPEYLAVPVARDSSGALAIAGYPAFVGRPAVSESYAAASRQSVGEPALVAMVTRLITNYLDDDAQDLQADLAPGARVSLPTAAMSVVHVASVTWVRPNTVVEVQVTARDSAHSTFSLTYEVGVTERERWYVTSIAVNPSAT
jgi:Conjugative transposon protein TcpC